MHSAAGTRFAVTIKARFCQNVVISVDFTDFNEFIVGTSGLRRSLAGDVATPGETGASRIHTFIHKT